MESRDFLEWALHTFLQVSILILFPPFFVGLIVKLKAVAAGRKGAPILQPYYDLARLCRKGTVYSLTTGPVFRMGPIFVVASAMVAGLMLPIAGMPAVVHFSGDLIVFAYVMALGRLAIVMAALDTGSSFEGMGASREVSFAAIAEPTFFLILISVGLLGHADPHNFGVEWSLTGTLAQMEMVTWGHYGPALLPLSFALFVLLLLETSRVPFDDPTTHLELTMIHEVMILDHSGPDLLLADVGVFFLKVSALCVIIVIVEVGMARLRMKQIPSVLLGALILAALSVVVMLVELGEFKGLPT